jgi:hypothetical protein
LFSATKCNDTTQVAFGALLTIEEDGSIEAVVKDIESMLQ